MAVTGKQIAETTLEAIKRDGGSIWGQQGATWTAAKQAALKKKYESDPEEYKNYKLSAQYGSKWIGHPVWDCAGLCRWAAKQNGVAIHAGSNLIWRNDLSSKGAITKGMQLPVGALVFTGTEENNHPHIGTYTGNGKVTEANGAIHGCIQSDLSNSKWKWWGLEKGVAYEFIPGGGTETDPAPAKTKPTIRKGNKNQYVKECQEILKKLGSDLGICGVDGDFGTATERAVKAFQEAHDGPDGRALTVDGIVGPATWWALETASKGQEPEPVKSYTVTISGLMKGAAEELVREYPNAVMTETSGK